MQRLRHMMALNGAYTGWGAALRHMAALNGAYTGRGAALRHIAALNGTYTGWGEATQAHDSTVWRIHKVGCSESGT